MKSFIFITSEGSTFQPGSEALEPDIENCQVLGFADGTSPEDAFKNLIEENGSLLQTSFNETTCIELTGRPGRIFYLNGFENCSNL